MCNIYVRIYKNIYTYIQIYIYMYLYNTYICVSILINIHEKYETFCFNPLFLVLSKSKCTPSCAFMTDTVVHLTELQLEDKTKTPSRTRKPNLILKTLKDQLTLLPMRGRVRGDVVVLPEYMFNDFVTSYRRLVKPVKCDEVFFIFLSSKCRLSHHL